jgi:hypothetical protein
MTRTIYLESLSLAINNKNHNLHTYSVFFKLIYLEVSNYNTIICSNSSLLECSPAISATRFRYPAETCLSRDALVENENDLGQASPEYCNFMLILRLFQKGGGRVEGLEEASKLSIIPIFRTSLRVSSSTSFLFF